MLFVAIAGIAIRLSIAVSMVEICEQKWASLTGPESHYGPDYFAWQVKVSGNNTGLSNQLRRRVGRYTNTSPAKAFAGKTIVDVGCGGGAAASQFHEAAVRYCFEINPFAISAHPTNVASVSSWGMIDDNSVDIMYSHHSFEHHPHPLLSLQCATRKLKHGGTFILAVPMEHAGCGMEGNDYGQYFDVPNDSFHIFTWNPRVLGHFMTAAGFSDIECTDLRGMPTSKFADHPFHTLTIHCTGRWTRTQTNGEG